MRKLFLKENPFIRLCCFYMAGILMARYAPGRERMALIMASAIVLAGICLLLVRKDDRSRHLRGCIIFIFLSGAGASVYHLQNRHSCLPEEVSMYDGIVLSAPLHKDNYYQFDFRISGRLKGDSLFVLNENVRLYAASDSLLERIRIGDRLVIRTQLIRIRNRGNPGEFDYAGYMADEGILYTGWVQKGDVSYMGYTGKKALLRFSSDIRRQLIRAFSHYGIQGAELGVISALAAGDRQYLDPATRSDYIRAGAMHVLAVSGLHVGILYLFLNLLFGSRYRRSGYRVFRFILILSALWLYALITGLPVSVIRASVMFSFFLAGKSFNRSAGSYNLMAASAFFILLFDPNELFKPGFQYSYLAVLGILYFQPLLAGLRSFRHSLPDRIWQLLTVSFAAQLTTFPLALYYFHQFPCYFLITNLFVIPLVWLIMMTTLFFFLTLPVPMLVSIVSKLLNTLIHLNNDIVARISELPLASVSHIRFDTYHLLLTYLLILRIMHCLNAVKKKQIAFLLLIYTILLSGYGILLRYPGSEQTELIIYSVEDFHAISYIRGSRHLLISRTRSSGNRSPDLQYLEPYWVSQGIYRSMQTIRMEDHPGKKLNCGSLILHIDSNSYAVSNGKVSFLYPPQRFSFTGTPNQTFHWLIDRDCGYPDRSLPPPDAIIFMKNLPGHLRKAWQDYCHLHTVRIHDMDQSGAFRLNL